VSPLVTTPQRLGGFEVSGVLGEGGSAVVYAAHDGMRHVALKVLHPDQYVDARHVERFVEEAEKLQRVRHPSLVQVYGCGVLPGGRPFIAMPRLVGTSLAHRLERGPLPLRDALALFDGLAGAVAALHHAGLLHRDIKPENVFYCEGTFDDRSLVPIGDTTGGTRLVLLDLGIARDTATGPSTTTRAGFMRGTPAYMAPERLFGRGASAISDVYELALLLFLMLTAHLPWDEGDPAGRIHPRFRPEDGARVPQPLQTVLLEALHVDVNKRCQSADELAARVRAVNVAVSVGPPPPSMTPAAGLSGASTPNSPFGASTESKVYAVSTPNLPVASLAASHTPVRVGDSPPDSKLPFSPTLKVRAPRAGRSPLPWLVAALAVGAASVGAWFVWPRGLAPPPALEQTTDSATAALTSSAGPEITPIDPPPLPSTTASVPAPSASAEPSASSSASPSATTTKDTPIKEGVLPAPVIEARVKARIAGMNACLQGEAEKPEFQGGRVTLNFWIGLDGSVTRASGQGEYLPRAVVDCVVAQVRTISFPQPVGGPVNVIFPIRFSPPAPKP
jgi:eukaryotic-like serine/threonine-protein kinase